ncbi:MAG: NUDIX domain-containing protein [Acutalibacteraceae bacterium]|nr:NUDIX domain-containing protein [Acutalibacteraceae bacterium]
MSIEVKFYENIDDELLKFAVIISKSQGKWVYVKHKERNTFEIPGGHREERESILDTAKRELYEETGAIDYKLTPICVYSVTQEDESKKIASETFGMLFYADIYNLEKELHNEIEFVKLFDNIPQNQTYPQIQPFLVQEFERRIEYSNLST